MYSQGVITKKLIPFSKTPQYDYENVRSLHSLGIERNHVKSDDNVY